MIILNNSKSNSKIINLLINLGAHIGDLKNYTHFDHNIFSNVLCVRNDFFVFDLEITCVHFQRALRFVFHLSFLGGKLLFYHSDIDSYFFKFIFFFLIKNRTLNSFINTKFHGGYLSNYRQCFLRFIKILSNIPIRIKSKRRFRKLSIKSLKQSINHISFFYRFLFIKLLSLTYKKTFLKRDWDTEFRKILVFWKSFVFIRSFKSIFQIPDCLVCINPLNNWNVVSEYSRTNKFPSIGVIDTSSASANCTYSIPSNDDSIPLSLFYITVILNVWSIGYLYKCRSFFKL